MDATKEIVKDTLPPGPKGLPVIGPVLQFQYSPLNFFRALQQQYGDMATVHIGNRALVLFFKPEHIRYFLTENARNFVKPQLGDGSGLKAFLGDGLLTIDGDYHRQQRRLVQPAFHRHRVDSYGDTMVQFTQEMLDSWQPGAVVDISSEMQQLTLRIINKTLFNVDSPQQSARLGKAFTDVINGSKPVRIWFERLRRVNLPFTTYGKSLAGGRVIDEFIYKLIAQRRAEDQDTGDVLSMLLAAQDEGNTMTDRQIHDHVLTFVAAGHETAQNTLAWTFYLLAQHPQVLEKLVAELNSVLNSRAPTLQDLPNLPYLEGVINESWRFYPPAWRQARQAIDDFELDGYSFPAGTIAILSQWVMHNLPEIWGDPENFRPERWDPKHGQKVPQGAYFPFGLGPHICIGMPFAQLEARLLLATIIQRFTPRLVPGFRVVFQPLVTLRPKHGIRMLLEPTRLPAATADA